MGICNANGLLLPPLFLEQSKQWALRIHPPLIIEYWVESKVFRIWKSLDKIIIHCKMKYGTLMRNNCCERWDSMRSWTRAMKATKLNGCERKNTLISKTDYYCYEFEWRSSLWFRMPLSLRKYWFFFLIFAVCQQSWNEFPLNEDKFPLFDRFCAIGFRMTINLIGIQNFHSKFATLHRKRWKINIINGNRKDINPLLWSNNRRKRQRRRRRDPTARATPLSDSKLSCENENGVKVETHFHYSTKLFYDWRVITKHKIIIIHKFGWSVMWLWA